MRKMLPAALFLVATVAQAQVVTEMTPERIREAIADKKTAGCYTLKKGYACFTTPYSRVVQAARSAKREYQPFTENDVTPEMVAPVVEVLAFPQPSFVIGSGRVGPPIDVKAVVVMPKGSKDREAALLPTATADLDSRYQNLMGAKWDARGVVARFPLFALTESHEVRVVYDGKGCSDWKFNLTSECGFQFKLDGVK